MRINSAGSTSVNLLQSDVFTFRNQDFVSANNGAKANSKRLAAVSAKFSVIQIWNRVGSGVTMLVDSLIISSSSTSLFGIGITSDALLTAWTRVNSKLGGVANGETEIRYDNPSSWGLNPYAAIDLQSNIPFEYLMNNPAICAEGEGIVVGSYSTNVSLNASFTLREI